MKRLASALVLLSLTACTTPFSEGSAPVVAAADVADDAGGAPAQDPVRSPVPASVAPDAGQVTEDAGSPIAVADAGGDAELADAGQDAAASCATLITHSNGEGQTFEDCNPLGTYTRATATEACHAYIAVQDGGVDMSCNTNVWCGGTEIVMVCSESVGDLVTCWSFVGPKQIDDGGIPGNVYNANTCATGPIGTWQ